MRAQLQRTPDGVVFWRRKARDLARLIIKHAHSTPEECGHGTVECLAQLACAADELLKIKR